MAARGSLDTLQAGVATTTPDLLTGWVVLHPVRHEVPMKGALLLKIITCLYWLNKIIC